MAHRKRRLDQLKHPFSPHPFEAVAFGSWQAVEFIKIEAGTMSMHFADNHHVVMEKGPLSDIRIRSRKATLPDCSRFLRPGIDVCVLSAPQQSDDADAGINLDPVWTDAKISSVQRKPHDSECSCQFYVNFYVHQGSLGAELRTLNKEIKVVGINQISILQKLESTPCENQHYRWASSEDCSIISHTKLLLGKVLCDLSWLVVTTALKKKVSFCVRSLEDKLVYQVLERDTTVSTSLNNESHIDVVNFKTEKGTLFSIVSQVATLKTKRVEPKQESHEDKESPSYNVEGLRRSKRRNVQPERYLGCEKVSQIDVGSFRNLPPVKINIWKDDDVDHEMNIPLAGLFSLQKKFLEGDTDNHQKVKKASSCRELVVYQRKKTKSQKVKSGGDDQNEHQNHLAIIALPAQHDPVEVIHCDDLNDKVTRSYGHESSEVSSKYRHLIGTTSKKNDIKLLTFESHNHAAKSDDADKIDDLSSRYHYSYGTPKSQRMGLSDLDDMVDLGNKWEGISSSKGFQGKKQRTTYLRSRDHGEQKRYNYKDRSLNAAAYKDLINSYLKNMNTRPTNEEPAIADQWKQSETPSNIGQKTETQMLDEEDAEEESEMDMLWRELEVSLASCYLEEETEDSHAAVFTETLENPNPGCPHDFRMNEEIGIYCYRCGFVSTEIKYITPPFIQHSVRHQEEKQSPEEDSKTKPDEDDDIDLLPALDSPEKLVSQENENVWALIPELKAKLHAHQKKAFEFLWQNIAGSMDPELMETASKRRGGCVISHTPGAGKTFLIIAFLVSYLKLFPGKRPLVLAPKTTLYTWYKEFIKWDIPIPVYLIHGRRTYRVFKQKSSIVIPGVPKPTDDVKHVLDCLEKIQKWHSHPSVLIMGYTSFLTLMREDSKFAHRKYMAKVLRESPGIMVLDEGHNPRSTKSRLRKVLMKVQTELRILLSGTLFQNNFCEYFNTLCLARPKFIHEVLKALDSKYKRKGKVAKKASHLLESRARKFFLDQIAKKIDSNNGRERRQGLKMLRNVTNGFIDVYEGRSSDGLPGLQIYTLLMNSTDTQHEILHELHKKMARVNGYPLELELLITLGSIHPWLVKSAVCAEKFFTPAQLMELEKCKFDLRIGSKVKFVLSLIYRVVKKEKVLIFCHNIAPVKLFVEYFEKYFGWTKGREVLVLTGELELFERGRVMDKFEEPGGVAKILLASITACAEGISLTAASRVIMLDSEWNPSKTKQAIARAFRPGQQKVVYVYQLLVTGSLEEDKYKRTTWKEWVSSMIFSEAFVEDPSQWQAEKIEDYILREMVAEDRSKSFHMIMKNEKTSTNK